MTRRYDTPHVLAHTKKSAMMGTKNAGGLAGWNNNVVAPQVPAQVGGGACPVATAVNGGVMLQWDAWHAYPKDPTTGVSFDINISHWDVYRNTTGTKPTVAAYFVEATFVASVVSDHFTDLDSSLAPGTTYYYWVVAVNLAGVPSEASAGSGGISPLPSHNIGVGSIFITTIDDGGTPPTPTNPASILGYGKWSYFGAGKTLVSCDLSDPDFRYSGAVPHTGGEKTHTLSVAELAQHSHGMAHTHSIGGNTGGGSNHTHSWGGAGTSGGENSHTHYVASFGPSGGTDTGLLVAYDIIAGTLNTGAGSNHTHSISLSGTTGGESSHTHALPANTGASNKSPTDDAGSSTAHNNLQPYIVVYMWHRDS